MLISGTEPSRLKDLGEVSPIPERYGADFLIVMGKSMLGIQRKRFPDDLLASLADGRLYDQLRSMRSLDRTLFIIEGHGQWTADGELLGMRKFTFAQLIGLYSSIMFEFGVPVLWVHDIHETIQTLEAIEAWAGKDNHHSLLRRPGPKGDAWGRITKEMIDAHVIQSFPGMGPGRALNFVRFFGGTKLKWDTSVEEMATVPGIGKQTAKRMWEALDVEPVSETPAKVARGRSTQRGKAGQSRPRRRTGS